MKLTTKIAATFCLAVLSLTGCATDDENYSGGHLEGMRPAKPSQDDFANQKPVEYYLEGKQTRGMIDLPDDVQNTGITATDVKPEIPLPGVCDDCQVTYITIPARSGIRDASEYGEIRVVNDGGEEICRIFMNQDGSLDTHDCN